MRALAGAALTLKLRLMLVAAGLLTALVGLLGFAVLGGLADAQRLGGESSGAGSLTCAASAQGHEAIPPGLMELYASAATDHGLGGRGMFVLAAINRIETDFGRNQGPSSAGAVGWMQFMPATWTRYGVDGDGDGRRDPANPADAIPAAAGYLRASGAPGDWYRAIFAYNHADWYVRDVLELADAYQGDCVSSGTPDATDGRLLWPMASRIVTAPFGQPRPGHRHAGLDIGAPMGAPIWAAADGVVVLVQDTATSGGYGNYVCLQHGASLRTCYAHLASIAVRAGQPVVAGQVIGSCGNTGNSFGPHLHFEVRLAPAWDPTDPIRFVT